MQLISFSEDELIRMRMYVMEVIKQKPQKLDASACTVCQNSNTCKFFAVGKKKPFSCSDYDDNFGYIESLLPKSHCKGNYATIKDLAISLLARSDI